MKRWWKLTFAGFLIFLSVLLYVAHYLVFKDAHHIFIYLLGDIAFVPISVLLVTLILEHLLEKKQKENRMHKLNMVLSAFFSEVGDGLIRKLDLFRQKNRDLNEHLQISNGWTGNDFRNARAFLSRFDCPTNASEVNLEDLYDYLKIRRPFLLTLLENPNLLEHDRMTDMLWAIFHLTEELTARKTLQTLGPKDLEHLSGDIKRVYLLVIREWVGYMQHLGKDYPFLFSLALRTNPFNPQARAEVA